MKHTFLKFDGQGNPLFFLKRTKRLPMRNSRSACFKEGGEKDPDDPEGGGDPKAEEKELLKKITKTMGEEFEKRGLTNKEAIAALVQAELKGIDIEGLKTYDAKKAEGIVKKLAGEFEKFKANANTLPTEKRSFKSIVEERLGKEDVASIIKNKRGSIAFNVRAAAVMTTENTVDDGEIPENLLESFTLAEFVGKRYGRQYIYDIADRSVQAELEQYITWLEEGDEEGAFAIVAEGALKPLVSIDVVRNYAETKKVAGKYIITEEFAKWRKNAYTIIRRLINDKLVRDYNAILTIDLQAAAAAYVGTALDGTINDANDYDAVGAVAAQIETLNFEPDVLIIHPQDKWRIRLTKDAEGRYLFPVVTEGGITTMLGLQVITSTLQTVGTFTMGEKGLYKIDEEPITMRMGYGITVTGSNPVTAVVSDFDNNQLRCILELFFRSYLATPNIGSFVTATFATVKAALETT